MMESLHAVRRRVSVLRWLRAVPLGCGPPHYDESDDIEALKLWTDPRKAAAWPLVKEDPSPSQVDEQRGSQ